MLPDDIPLTPHEVNLPETRPALWAGAFPLPALSALVVVTGEFAAQRWWWAVFSLPFWGGAYALFQHDHNMHLVWWTEIRTTLAALDGHLWGGSSVSSFPVKPYRHFYGVPSRAR